MPTWGIFNDEGQVEGDFASAEAAAAAIAARYLDDDGLHVAPCCHDHPEHAATACEVCDEDEDETKAESEDD